MKSPVRSAAIPNPTPLLFLLAGTVAWFVLWKEDPSATGLWVVLFMVCAIMVPVSVYALAVRPVLAITVLLVAVAIPRMYVELSGMKARPEHIICGLLLFALPYWFRKKKNQFVWMTADY